jgi:hypothetical protein
MWAGWESRRSNRVHSFADPSNGSVVQAASLKPLYRGTPSMYCVVWGGLHPICTLWAFTRQQSGGLCSGLYCFSLFHVSFPVALSYLLFFPPYISLLCFCTIFSFAKPLVLPLLMSLCCSVGNICANITSLTTVHVHTESNIVMFLVADEVRSREPRIWPWGSIALHATPSIYKCCH